MPLLERLSMYQGDFGHNVQVLSAVPLPSLHSLDIWLVDLRHAQHLQGYTQLKELSLSYTSLKDVGTLAQLAGLTKLELKPWERSRQLFSSAEQSELGSTLAALTNLKCLHIDHAPPGPVTGALSQLTALTELSLSDQGRVLDPGPLALPSVVRVSLGMSKMTVQQLMCLNAPQLKHFKGFKLGIKLSELPDLRRLCRGVLTACSFLPLDLKRAWSKEETVNLMTALQQDWQPSAEALSPTSSSSAEPQNRISCNPMEWRLSVFNTYCSRQALSLLPKGLNRLQLMWVTMGSGRNAITQTTACLRYQAALP
jgi:Leucine-rich repeat (LRR) protein